MLDIIDIESMHTVRRRHEMYKFISDYESCNHIKKCMLEEYPDKCEGEVINAHSVSNKSGLSKIASNLNGRDKYVGKIEKINERTIVPYFDQYGVKYISTSKASTFNGVCKKHDNLLFKNIDNSSSKLDEKHVFEHTLRNAIYHSYDRLSTAKCIQAVSYEYLRLFPKEENHFQEIYEITFLQHEKIKKEAYSMVSCVLNDDISKKLYYKIYSFNGNLNISGNLCVEHDGVIFYLTIIPREKISCIIVSCLRKNNYQHMHGFFNFLNSLDSEEMLLYFSEEILVPENIRHIYFNYSKWTELNLNLKEDVLNWLYLFGIDRLNKTNIRYLNLEPPNFIKYMLDI